MRRSFYLKFALQTLLSTFVSYFITKQQKSQFLKLMFYSLTFYGGKYDIKTKRNCKTYFFDCIKWNYYWINCFLAYSIYLIKIIICRIKFYGRKRNHGEFSYAFFEKLNSIPTQTNLRSFFRHRKCRWLDLCRKCLCLLFWFDMYKKIKICYY